MDELAEEIISHLKMTDRDSRLVLVAKSRNYGHPNDSYHTPKYRHVLRVKAPVVNGSLVFKVSYYDNHANPRGSAEWKHLEYKHEDVDGVVSFIGAFMTSGCRSDLLLTFETDTIADEFNEDQYKKYIGMTHLSRKEDDRMTNLARIRGAVKMLCGK